MAFLRQSSSIEVSFDGLTDAVTNLVGALIVLIVLLVGITSNAVLPTPPAPETSNVPPGSKSIDQLLRQVVVLRAGIEAVDQDISVAQQQLAEFLGELDEFVHNLRLPKHQ